MLHIACSRQTGQHLALVLTSFASSDRFVGRRRGGVNEWPGEHIFCNAARAVRFEKAFSVESLTGSRRRYCGFRRFFSDGEGLARIEVGVGFRGRQPWTLPQLLEALHDAASLPVSIGRPQQTVRTLLLQAGPSLARLTLNATTSRKAGENFKPNAWWLAPCEPLVLIEYNVERESVPRPPAFRTANHANAQGTELAYGRMSLLARAVGVWVFGTHNERRPVLLPDPQPRRADRVRSSAAGRHDIDQSARPSDQGSYPRHRPHAQRQRLRQRPSTPAPREPSALTRPMCLWVVRFRLRA